MATLAAWKFDTPTGADAAATTLQTLDDGDIPALRDAATVSWEAAWNKPRTRQLAGTGPGGSLGSAFWGLLFGMVFFVPLLGAATSAAGGALAGSLTDVGIDDSFINKVRDQVTPGTSALFVLGSDTALDAIEAAFGGHRPAGLIVTSLTSEQDRALRSVFAEGSAATP
jgi:uncharacterized membrane protein